MDDLETRFNELRLDPQLATIGLTRSQINSVAWVENKFELSLKEYQRKQQTATWLDRIATIQSLLTVAANELVPIAAQLVTASNTERHALVVNILMRLIEKAEKKFDFFNPVLQPLAFLFIRRGLDNLIHTLVPVFKLNSAFT